MTYAGWVKDMVVIFAYRWSFSEASFKLKHSLAPAPAIAPAPTPASVSVPTSCAFLHSLSRRGWGLGSGQFSAPHLDRGPTRAACDYQGGKSPPPAKTAARAWLLGCLAPPN